MLHRFICGNNFNKRGEKLHILWADGEDLSDNKLERRQI